jgi:signal transduction histidine kinase
VIPVRIRLAFWYALAVLLAGGVMLTGATLLALDGLSSYESEVGERLAAEVLERLEHARTEEEREEVLELMPIGIQAPLGRDPTDEFGDERYAIRAQAEADARAAARDRILTRAGLGLLGLVAVSAGAGYALAGRALRPVREITATAQEISAGRLDRRIGATGARDELRELADTLDAMLERLDRAFAEQRRFAAAASHELRTPLAVMRTAIDVALEDPTAKPTPRLELMIATLRDTLDRSERLVERLLVLARGDRTVQGEPVRLDELAARHAAEARERGAHVEEQLTPTTVQGDPVLLDQLVRNLVDNGVRHGSGTLVIATGEPALRVTSSGERLDEDHLPRHGIGLAIVRSVAAAHGGRVRLRARPEGGLQVDVALH